MAKIAVVDVAQDAVLSVFVVPQGASEVAVQYVLPNGDRVSPLIAGWVSPEITQQVPVEGGDEGETETVVVQPAGLFAVLPVVDFIVPEGKQTVGARTYEVVDGEVIEDCDVEDIPVVIPDRVTSRQFKLQLLAAGLLDGVEAWIGAQSRAVQIAFENSGTFVRDEPMMQAGFAALGFTEQQIDDFFIAAGAL